MNAAAANHARLVAIRDERRAEAHAAARALEGHHGKESWAAAWAAFELADDRYWAAKANAEAAYLALRAAQNESIAGL